MVAEAMAAATGMAAWAVAAWEAEGRVVEEWAVAAGSGEAASVAAEPAVAAKVAEKVGYKSQGCRVKAVG